MGVAVRGPGAVRAGGRRAGGRRAARAHAADFDRYPRQSYYIDVYNRGQTPFDFRDQSADRAVGDRVARSRGTVKRNSESGSASIGRARRSANSPPTSRSPGRTISAVVVRVVADNRVVRRAIASSGLSKGTATSRWRRSTIHDAVNAPPVSWQRIPDFGRTLSGMTTSPADAPVRRGARDVAAARVRSSSCSTAAR